MSRGLKKLLAVSVTVIYLLSTVSTAFSQPSDISGNSAAGLINKWLAKGLTSLQSDGTYKPNEPLKRVEFFSMVNKVFSYTEKANTSFIDVIQGSSYTDDISKAVAAGYLQGDKKNKAYPFSLINRLDVAQILVKVFELKSDGSDEVGTLSDVDRIPGEYRNAVNIMLQNNYMGVQEENRFNPYGNITRADAVIIIDKMMGELYNKSGSYSGGTKNNVIINTGGVTLKGIKINGDLYLSEGIGTGSVTLDGINVKGRIIIHGGGPNTIAFKNSSAVGEVLIDKKDGKIRLTADGNSNFPSVAVYSGVTLENSSSWIAGFRNIRLGDLHGQQVTLNGNYDTVSVDASGSKVQLSGNMNRLQLTGGAADSSIRTTGGTIGKLDIQAPRTVVNLGGGNVTELNLNQDSAAAKIIVEGATVGTFEPNAGMSLEIKSGAVNRLNLQKGAEGSVVQIAKNGSIGTLNAYAGATFKGQGPIAFANIYSNGISMEQRPGSLTAQTGLNTDIGGNPTNPVSTLSITASDLTVQKGSTGASVVTVIPSDAKLSYLSKDITIATVDTSSGIITGTGSGTATIVVTGSKTGYFNSSASFKVTVTPLETVNSGTLSTDVNSAVVGSTKTITLTYVPGEPASNGTFNFILPSGFTATTNDTVNIAGTGAIQLSTSQLLNGGQTVSIAGATLGANQKIELVLKDKTIPSAGTYSFRVTADSDGQGPKAPSPGTGTESVQFEAVAKSVIWSATAFTEAAANDGSVGTTINLSLTNETFVTGPFVSGTHFTVTNVPSGLTVNVNRTGNTSATVTLTGNAASHATTNSITNMGISFTNAAFAGGNASMITNSSKSNLAVSFNDPDKAVITTVSATNADGYYKEGDTINITVNFNKAVDVTGRPIIPLETGVTDESAVYSGGTGTSTLTFSYTVQPGDTSADLDYTTAGAISLNGGEIKNAGTNIDAVLTLPAPGAPGSLGANKNMIIDTTSPTAINISAQNSIPGKGSVTLTAVGGPLSDASWTAILNEIKANTNTSLSWITGVPASDLTIVPSQDGVTAVLDNANSVTALIKGDFVITAANITDRAGNTAASDITVDSYVTPLPASITGVSATNPDGIYKAGTILHITVNFDKAVDVTGAPVLNLETGIIKGNAVYASGTGTQSLVFDYTVMPGDISSDLDYTGTSALSVSGGAIKVKDSNIDAGLTLPAPGTTGSLGANKAIAVDTITPSAINISSQNIIPAKGNVTLTAVGGPLTNASWNNILAQIRSNTGTTGAWITGITSGNLTITPSSDGVTAILSNTNLNIAGTIVADFSIDAANIVDRAGNIAVSSITIDSYTAVPKIIDVNTTVADAYYNKDKQIDLKVTFDQPVDVDTANGTPYLTLETGTVDRNADYQGGTGTATLTFRYIVQSNDTSPDLDYKSINALVLNGGTIKTAGGAYSASLTLPAVGTFSAAHAIVIDTTPPTAINISVQNAIPANGSITLTAINGPLTSASWNAVFNQIKSNTGAGSNWIVGVSGTAISITPSSDGNTATISNSDSVDASITTDFVITASNITDLAGNTAAGDITIDSYLPPTPALITAVSATNPDGSYMAGSVIHVTVTFDKAVDVTGSPLLNLETGSTDRNAVYSSGTGTAALTFNYTVQAGDSSSDLDYTSIAALSGGTIKNKNSSTSATLLLPAPGSAGSLGNSKNIAIDTAPPQFDASAGVSVNGAHKVVTLVFSEPIANNEADYTALKSDITFAADGSNFTALNALDTVSISGGNLVITFNTAITGSNNKIKVNGNAVRDIAGNVKTDITATNNIDASADNSPPILTGASLDPTHKIVTLAFDEPVVNNKADIAALKSQISFASNGINYLPLGTSDTVAISGGNLVITFNTVLNGANNNIRINANTLKDAVGNVKFDITYSGPVDASSDITPPVYSNAVIDAGTHKIVTLNFNENIVNNTIDFAALKASIQFAANGTSYTGLGTSDIVSITNNSLIITFNSALTGALNKIKVNANALRDSSGNVKSDVTVTEAIDASADILPPAYTGASLDGTHKIVTMTFSENLVNNKTDLQALKDEISLAADGTNFTALGGSDSVVVSGSSIIITFNNVLTGNTNKIRINASALKDSTGNVKTDMTQTSTIDASADITPPVFNAVSGTSLDAAHKIVSITFNEPVANNKSTIALLKAEITLAADGSTFNALGSSDTVTVTGSSIVITFSSPLTGASNIVKVNANAIKDTSGNVKTDMTITNAIDASADIAAPTFNSATGTALDATHKIITLTFSEPIVNNKTDLTALKGEITFAANGTSFAALGGSDTIAINSDKLVITFHSVLTGALNKMKVNANALKDAAGNVKTDITLTNAIDASADVTPPTLVSAVVTSSNTDKIVLTYDEALKNLAPDAGDFAIGGADAGGRTVTSIALNAASKTVTLTLSSGISYGNVITVSYTKGTNPVQDAAGNAVADLTGQAVTNNVAASASVSVISSTNADGTYKAGQVISISVVFSSAVDVTGSPVLHLETGTTDRDAVYASGTGTNTLTFNYVIQSGDTSADLDYIDANSLIVSGGAIKNKGTTINAALVLPNPAAAGSLSNSKTIVIDTDPPVNNATYPKAGANTDTTATIIVQTNENGRAYYVVLQNGATTPSAVQVKAGTDASGISPAANLKGNVSIVKNIDGTINLSGLNVSSNYDAYVICDDSVGNLQTTPAKVQLTTSVLVLTGVGVDVANGKITNTATSMQYSLDSTNGTNGTWSDCTAGSTNAMFVAGKVFIREKANPLNYALVANIAGQAAAPDVSGVTYSVIAGTIAVPSGSPVNQYSLAGGAWIDVIPGTTASGILFTTGDIQFRAKATASALPSFAAYKATVPAPTSAPNLYYSDITNLITGLDGTYEYKIGTGAWVSGDVPGDFSGTVTVQVRLKATSTTLPSQIQTMNFTTNLNLNGVSINVAAGQITGTTTAMQYSLNSSDGTDGTWSDCTANNTNVIFGVGKVYVRAKAQSANFNLVATIAAPVSAPSLAGISYDVSAGTITGVNMNLQYRLNGGSWINIVTAPNISGISYVAGPIDIRSKPTATQLASQSATLATIAPAANAPELIYDDLANTVTGLGAAYEYKIGSGAWTSGDVAGDFSGTATVQIRTKATSGALASMIQTINFTANLNLNVAGVNVAGGQITGTSTQMQYSLNSTDGIDGTWTDCTGSNTNVTFAQGYVYVRAKAQPENFRRVATISAAASAPSLTGITYDISAKTISGVNNTLQYQLANGSWIDINGTVASSVNFVEGDINIRTKATTTTLASITATLDTVAPAPDAPTLAYDDVANTISGLSSSYEYKIGNWAWTSGDIPGDFSGTVVVQVRLKATSSTLAGLVQTMNFTANLDLSGVTVDITNSKLNGTLTTMQYSLNSTTGTDGSWTDCTNNYTTVSFSNARSVSVRAKAQPANYLMLKTAAAAPPVTANTTGGQNAVKLVGSSTSMEYSRDGGTTWTSVTTGIAGGTQTIDVSIAPNNDLRVRIRATSGTLASLPTVCLNPLLNLGTVGIDVSNKTLSGTATTMEFSLNSTTGINGTWVNCTSPITLVSSFSAGNVYVRVKNQPTNYKLIAVIAAQDVAPSAVLSDAAATPGRTKITMLDPSKDYQYVIDGNPILAGNASGWSQAIDVAPGSSQVDNVAADATQYIHIRVKGTTSMLPSAVKDITVKLTDIQPANAPNATVNDMQSAVAYIRINGVRALAADGLEYNLDGNGWTDVLDNTTVNLTGAHTLYVRVKATNQLPSSNLTGDLDTTP